MDPIRTYLTNQDTLVDGIDMEQTSRKAMLYTMVDGILYKQGRNGVLLKCITQTEGNSLLRDIHRGICGSHISHRALVGKAFRQGFYWPIALQDAADLVRTCESCQFFAKQIHQPAEALNTIPLSWPFATWGIDILGPFPKARGGYMFLIITIDTFTKWVEAEPVRHITKENTVKFLHGIIMRFGVPTD
jgi:hypothetical protein